MKIHKGITRNRKVKVDKQCNGPTEKDNRTNNDLQNKEWSNWKYALLFYETAELMKPKPDMSGHLEQSFLWT